MTELSDRLIYLERIALPGSSPGGARVKRAPRANGPPRTYGRVYTTSFSPISIYNCIKYCSKKRRQMILGFTWLYFI